MERVTFLVEDTHERITALLNPSSVVQRRSAVLRERRSLPAGPAGASTFFDHGPVVTGGAVTEMELDLLFDTSLAGSSFEADDVRALTEPLWRLAESREAARTGALELPQLRLIWGKAWNVPAVVVALAERLEHFDASGAARRSWLRLRLRRVPERAEPSPPGVLPGMPAAREARLADVRERAPAATSMKSMSSAGSTKESAEQDIPETAAAVLAEGEAKEIAEQAGVALRAAEENLVASGLVASIDLSVETSFFSFSASLSIDLSAITPRAIGKTIAGWVRWARDELASLGATVKRVGLAALRKVRAGIERAAERLEALWDRIAPEVRERLAAVRASLTSAARRVASLARVVFAEVRRRVVDGYRALARGAASAVRWIEQHTRALSHAIARAALSVRETLGAALDKLVSAARTVAAAVAEQALAAARAAAALVKAGAAIGAAAVSALASGVRSALAAAMHTAAAARDALVSLLREHVPEVARWAHDAVVRGVTALSGAALAAASAFERAVRVVVVSAVSALSDALSRARAWLASRPLRADASITWQLLEAASSDDVAATDASAEVIRARVIVLVARLGPLEQGSLSGADIVSIEAELDALSALVVAEQGQVFGGLVGVLDRPLARPARYGYARLDLVAFDQAGDPRAWKRIAEAQGIDDPLTVLSGASLAAPLSVR